MRPFSTLTDGRWLGFLGISLLLALLPTLLPILVPAMEENRFLLDRLLTTLILANVWAILAMSWDILSGYTGQISFGHSFFFGLGAYTAAALSVVAGWSPVWVIAIGGAVAALGGLLIAAPALRLRGPYLALMTLVAALALERFMRWLKPADAFDIGIPGAEGAILCIPDCFLSHDATAKYYYVLGLMVLVAVALQLLARSRIGEIFAAIRDDEETAQACGVNTAKYKALAFAVSGFVGGLSGAFYVYHLGSASPASVLNLQRSVEAIVAAVLGGMGTITGPIGGAYLLVVVQEYLRPLGAWRFFALFALALLVLYLLPRGLLPEFARPLRRGREWLKMRWRARRSR